MSISSSLNKRRMQYYSIIRLLYYSVCFLINCLPKPNTILFIIQSLSISSLRYFFKNVLLYKGADATFRPIPICPQLFNPIMSLFTKIPPIFLPSANRSFTHLISSFRPVFARTCQQILTAVMRHNKGSIQNCILHRRVIQMFPEGLSHLLFFRPFPQFCLSATNTITLFQLMRSLSKFQDSSMVEDTCYRRRKQYWMPQFMYVQHLILRVGSACFWRILVVYLTIS